MIKSDQVFWRIQIQVFDERLVLLQCLGGICWTRCFDVSKSKRKDWRPWCWVCVCCLLVWNLLIHSLRWSKFIWILNLLKIWVSKMLLKFQQVVLLISINRLKFWNNRLFYLGSFWKWFWKAWLCCQVNSTDCFDKTIDCFPENLNRNLLSGFNMF